MAGSRGRAGGPDHQPAQPVGKVEIFNALRLAARSMGLNRTHLDLMWALINFPREQILRPGSDGRLIVFASNATLRSRLNVLADSTISRAIRTLETAGLVLRHMSPNRKRYRVRGAADDTAIAYGIDIWPFWLARERILAAARSASASAADQRIALARLRAALAEATRMRPEGPGFETTVEEARSMLRRRVDPAILHQAAARLEDLCAAIPTGSSAHILHDSDEQNARHIEDVDSEDRSHRRDPDPDPEHMERSFPKVTRLVRDVAASQPDEPLTQTLQLVALALGIARESWISATTRIGPVPALACLGRIAEDPEVIDRPSAYFAALVSRLATGETTLADLMRRRRPRGQSGTRSGCAAAASHATLRPPAGSKETAIEASPH